jgi:hypothetical protein
VTFHGRLAIALGGLAVTISLAGCATSPIPGSPEEQLWFDKPVGADIIAVSPELRLDGAIGYPRTDYRSWQPPPDPGWR